MSIPRTVVSRFALLAVGLGILFSNVAFAGQPTPIFPLRVDYPDTPTIETESLQANMNDYLIVDVRSAYEYDTLHIYNAVNVPLADPSFRRRVKELYGASHKPIVTYCNGETCPVSYQAARLIKSEGIPVHAYDAGIWRWTRNYPEDSVLLGKRGAAKLIAPEQFNARLLSPEEFARKVNEGNPLVLDVRSSRQAGAGVRLWPFKQVNVPLGVQDLGPHLQQAVREKRPLLIYDANGRQVRWVQYAIEHAGVSDYFFLDGGAAAYEREQMGDTWKPISDTIYSSANP